MPLINLTEHLVKLANPQGGWGYYSNNSSSVEPTCLALLALGKDFAKSSPEGKNAISFLMLQLQDSGLVINPGCRKEAVWPTAIALFTLVKLEIPGVPAARMASALLALEGFSIKGNAQAKEIHANGIDVELTGWPWTRGTFSWVEPTAWAVLALCQVGLENHPRVKEGQAFLLDRLFDEGGTNYGTKRVLGKLLDTIPIPTSLALMALQKHALHLRIRSSLDKQAELLETWNNAEDCAWAFLTLDLYDSGPKEISFLPFSHPNNRPNESRPRKEFIPKLALSLAASRTGSENPFRISNPASIGKVDKAKPPKETWGDWFRNRIRRFALRGLAQLTRPEQSSLVSLAHQQNYEEALLPKVAQLYEPFRLNCPIKGKKVFIKPNLVEYNPVRPIHTHPAVVEALIQLCLEEGAAEILVGEGSGHRRNMEALVDQCGLQAVLARHGVEFVDINHDEYVGLRNMGPNTGLDRLYFCRKAAEADVLISLPKMKTHHWATVTLGLKNLFGLASGQAYGWPKNDLHFRGIPHSIVDINCTRKADLVLVDGIMGMQGDGPLSGDAIQSGLLVMGTDPLAVDSTCARFMGFNPKTIGHLQLAYSCGIGNLDEKEIRLIGEIPEPLSFTHPPKEFAS